ncbi:Pyruvate/Phosphoenolpyruvate kinase-like domain-containing protein [Hyaloraphidium curvatum]|nr:Pyruvate/Phosphoenolpyruvate kinase-like domain-containing protein [Hyaloraphidium curvatum]
MAGSDDRKLQSSLKSAADTIVYDLEDGVAINRKGEAREKVFNALETFDIGKREKAVRINSVGSGLEVDDLSVILRSKNLRAIVIPKVQSASDVLFVARMIDAVAPESNRQNVRLLAAIESAMGILNLREISTSEPRMDGLIFASEDYCADVHCTRTPSRTEMQYARQALVTHAAAFGLQAIDLVCVDYQNDATLEEECNEGRQWGFTGKQAIHPRQVDIIQRVFAPSSKDVEYAKRIVDGFDEFVRKGVGAFTLDGKMIDAPVVKWAQKIIARDSFIRS